MPRSDGAVDVEGQAEALDRSGSAGWASCCPAGPAWNSRRCDRKSSCPPCLPISTLEPAIFAPPERSKADERHHARAAGWMPQSVRPEAVEIGLARRRAPRGAQASSPGTNTVAAPVIRPADSSSRRVTGTWMVGVQDAARSARGPWESCGCSAWSLPLENLESAAAQCRRAGGLGHGGAVGAGLVGQLVDQRGELGAHLAVAGLAGQIRAVVFCWNAF